ncbi:hypothetical protein CONPUDRAFT_74690 [Coniophora puteana RWD-64-598 SS2]|uniref:VLRF1 domain-containing protein n=1 Tax=Coniophora puteana (strain RWD-64-598) TaxID=741705 RepID=A0A5M3MJI1_CONPW|nr:uncharacterized protein CONPUDRAFT_74690 [Coniophora puteana RWD-64-598 SS2]EIW79206.1 hypothetical protein CONPUDRAFT_74690 [Coniophora puteana RWD-64-598 SS2]
MAQRYHLFSLPDSLLEALTPRNLISQTPPPAPSPEPVLPSSTGNARACNICLSAAFEDVNAQRSHFRSDWHRYNVKIRLNGGNPVTEAAFDELVDGLDDSLSGSASSDDDSSESDAVKALVNKNKRISRSPSPSEKPNAPRTAIVWFHTPPATQIGVYRLLFPQDAPASSYLSSLKEMQAPVEGGRKWALFMTAGGHFAGAIVRVSHPSGEEEPAPSAKAKKKPPKPKPETEILLHKTFHRYTTRKKQGGSQGLNDNAKGAAISAGAMLRRYGERALRDDIRGLIEAWADEIHQCERIWIRASVSNRRIFLDYEGSVIQKGDDRLRTFPFPTNRPVTAVHMYHSTQSELSRCLNELIQVKVSHFTEDALRAQDEAYLASLPKPKPPPSVPKTAEPEKPKQPRLSKEEEQSRETWHRLFEMVTKGRLEPLKLFWDREGEILGGVNAVIPDWTGDRCTSLLQVAAQAEQEAVVQWLLYDLHADPTIPVSGHILDAEDANASDVSDTPATQTSGRTAYDLAHSKAVRNVFRRCAAEHPDWWDWFGTAHVPSALTKEMEVDRDDKKKQRRKGLKDKIREREAKQREKSDKRDLSEVMVEPAEVPPPSCPARTPSGPQRLGGASATTESTLGLTPDVRARIERERRARAAEARLR